MAKRVPIFGYWGIYPRWIITSDLGLAAWVSYALNKMDIESQGTIHRLPVIRANRYHSIIGRRPLRDVVLAKLENMVSGLFLRLYLSSDDSRINSLGKDLFNHYFKWRRLSTRSFRPNSDPSEFAEK